MVICDGKVYCTYGNCVHSYQVSVYNGLKLFNFDLFTFLALVDTKTQDRCITRQGRVGPYQNDGTHV